MHFVVSSVMNFIKIPINLLKKPGFTWHHCIKSIRSIISASQTDAFKAIPAKYLPNVTMVFPFKVP